MTSVDLHDVPADNPMFITSAMNGPLSWPFANAIGEAAPSVLEWANTQAVTDWYGAYCGA